MRLTEENGIPVVEAEYDELDQVAGAIVAQLPVRHIRIITNAPGLAYQCTGCGYYYESTGRDSSARSAASLAWAAHLERANA